MNYGSIFVVARDARDRKNKAVLLGGLGSVGVGRAWSDETGAEAYAGFENAPEACCPMHGLSSTENKEHLGKH